MPEESNMQPMFSLYAKGRKAFIKKKRTQEIYKVGQASLQERKERKQKQTNPSLGGCQHATYGTHQMF